MKKSILISSILLLLASCSSSGSVISSKSTPIHFSIEESSEKESSSKLDSSEAKDIEKELRDNVVSYMEEMATLRWTPSEDITYYENDGTKFIKGKEYIGIPYSMGGGRTTSLGHPLETFKENLSDDNYTYIGPTGYNSYIGSDCSSSIEGAYRVNGIVTNAIYTGAMIPGENNKIKPVGDFDYSSRKNMSRSIVESNGKEKMFSCYSLLKKGDVLVKREKSGNSFSGHARMIKSINILNEEVTVIEQCGYGIDNQTITTWRNNKVYSFTSLFNYAYLPISFI